MHPIVLSDIQAEERFDDIEVRVIRPRYFNKSGRLELGAELATIMNETFINTFMATGLAAFHFTEDWAVEGSFSFGFNVDNTEKRLLRDSFNIKTQIFQTSYNGSLGLQWTPIYGKWQLSSGRLIYFDTFFYLGGGLSGIFWEYSDYCDTGTGDKVIVIPDDTTISYPTITMGIGQRYFVTKSTSYRIDLRLHSLLYSNLDPECEPEKAIAQGFAEETLIHSTITFQLGGSYYF
jgi:outer membrane beta-barrel protein